MNNLTLENWKTVYRQKMQRYTDGLTEFGDEPVGEKIEGFHLRAGMDGEVDQDAVEQFIQTLLDLKEEEMKNELSSIAKEIEQEKDGWGFDFKRGMDKAKEIINKHIESEN